MFRRLFLSYTLASLGAGCLMADFSFEQTSKITGGMMAGMMKIAGAFSKQAREPIVSSVLVKGDRMAHVDQHRIHVIDLKQETVTDIDMQKKQYSVITFADMAKAMARMQEKMAQKSPRSGDPNAQMEFKASVNQTGATRMISGMNAKETILTLEMLGADAATGQKGGMEVVADMWLAPTVAGYDEVRTFQRRMAEKMAWSPAGSGMMSALAQRPEMMKGMAEIAKQASKIDGVPVMQIIKIGAKSDGMAAANSGGPAPSQQTPQAPPPSVGGAAGNAAGSAAANAAGHKIGGLGGLAVGGLGGFGGMRRKKAEQEAPPAQAPPPVPAAPQAVPEGNAGVLIEMTTELTSFASGPVDPARFEVPAGFKKVESEMEKALR